MKRIKFGIILLVIIGAMMIGGCQKEDQMVLEEGEKYSLEAEKILTTKQTLRDLQPQGEGYILYAQGISCRLERDLTPSEWMVDDKAPIVTEVGRYTEKSDVYTIHSNRDIVKNDELLRVTMREELFPRGFWKIGDTCYLVADLVDDTGVAEGTALAPWEKDKPAEFMALEGMPGRIHLLATGDGFGYALCGDMICRTDGKKLDMLGSLYDCGIDPAEAVALLPDGDGKLLLATSNNLWVLRTTSVQLQELLTLTIGCYRGPSMSLSRQANEFNLQGGSVRVEFKQYDDRSKLNLAILSGEVDIIAGDNAGLLEGYARRGFLLELDNALSAELAQGDLIENIVDAGRVEGNLYYLPSYYKIVGMNLPAGLVEAEGVPTSMLELTRMLEKLDSRHYLKLQCKEYALNNFLIHGTSAWVDRKNNQCSFEDNPDFLELLEICNRFASDPDEVLAYDHSETGLIMEFMPCYSVSRVYGLDLQSVFENDLGTPVTKYGSEGQLIPCPTGGGMGLTIMPDSLCGIVKTSPNVQAAVEWIRFIISEETYREEQEWILEVPVGFPLRKSMVEELVIASCDGYEAEDREQAIAQYQDSWHEIFYRADHFFCGGVDEISDIIREEALRYFAGDITAEQAAAYVQNRVSIYLAEQG